MMLITALHAAQTLATFHGERVQQTLGTHQAYHQDMARRCTANVEDIRRALAESGVSVENQANVLSQRYMAAAHAIIDRHPLTQGRGVDDVPAARKALAKDISSAIAASRELGAHNSR